MIERIGLFRSIAVIVVLKLGGLLHGAQVAAQAAQFIENPVVLQDEGVLGIVDEFLGAIACGVEGKGHTLTAVIGEACQATRRIVSIIDRRCIGQRDTDEVAGRVISELGPFGTHLARK